MLPLQGVTLAFQKLLLLKDKWFLGRHVQGCCRIRLSLHHVSTNKYIPWPPFGLPQSIFPPSAVWEDIAVDFIISLPAYQRHSVSLVVVDIFSKVAHFGILPAYFSGCKAAELFTHMICKLHGYPRNIISDRHPIFISKCWQVLSNLMELKSG